MAIVRIIAEFPYPAPRAEDIARMAEEISGLNVQCRPNDLADDAAREYSAKIFFNALPEEQFDVYTYRQGVVREIDDNMNRSSWLASPFTTEGYDDRDGVQRVYVSGYVGQEQTALGVAVAALVKLGGKLEDGQYYLDTYGKRLSEEELLNRHSAQLASNRKLKPWLIVGGVMNILFLPAILIWTFLALPFRLLAAYRRHPKRSMNRRV